ncbi:uncharacterized protein B0I36DRAFT_314554 [Microdochium trichocladiopsis]|uniref:Uncharacterized protein n=1 Tax=Microdochium trichocladiopsis TaxID=1682393 RepID=A0A9P9BU31_9PEZI|nr:uncharacterized protein B0I36DRAFT_314554 [Microdochium trichocladiopsis]KAH7037662.1 hypothetical protein B0I36DRAFT_314554 [Microdochium trichocladiopsis]
MGGGFEDTQPEKRRRRRKAAPRLWFRARNDPPRHFLSASGGRLYRESEQTPEGTTQDYPRELCLAATILGCMLCLLATIAVEFLAVFECTGFAPLFSPTRGETDTHTHTQNTLAVSGFAAGMKGRDAGNLHVCLKTAGCMLMISVHDYDFVPCPLGRRRVRR